MVEAVTQPARIEQQRLVQPPRGQQHVRQRARAARNVLGREVDDRAALAAHAERERAGVAAQREPPRSPLGVVPGQQPLDLRRIDGVRLYGADNQHRLE